MSFSLCSILFRYLIDITLETIITIIVYDILGSQCLGEARDVAFSRPRHSASSSSRSSWVRYQRRGFYFFFFFYSVSFRSSLLLLE